MSKPPTIARPDVGRSNPVRILIVVVLPAPLGPKKPNISPGATAKLMPSTAVASPKRLVRRSTTTSGGSILFGYRQVYGGGPCAAAGAAAPEARPGRETTVRGAGL